MRPLCTSVAVLALVHLGWPSAALANGRFPSANQIAIDPSDGRHLIERTTYGLLESEDGGRSWRWTCEGAFDRAATIDPAIAIATSGRVVTGLDDGVSTSADDGCTWEPATGDVAGQPIIDLTVDATDARHLFALGIASVAESRDAAKSFHVVGAGFSKDEVVETIDVAPSDPLRLYVSAWKGGGSSPRAGVMHRSDDGGATWSTLPFDLAGGDAFFIAAIDPKSEDLVYARLRAPDGDRLVTSRDGGKTWKEAFRRDAFTMLGFALEPSGEHVAISGVAKDGLFVASTADLAFARVNEAGARCLRWTTSALLRCGGEPNGEILGGSSDLGRTFVPFAQVKDLTPRACSAASPTTSICAKAWIVVHDTLVPPVIPDAGPDASTNTPASSNGACALSGRSTPSFTLQLLIVLGAGARRLRRLRGRRRRLGRP